MRQGAIVGHAIRGSTDVATALADRAASIAESGVEVVPRYHGDVLAASTFAHWLAGNFGQTLDLLGTAADDVAVDWSDGARGLLGFIRGKSLFGAGPTPPSR